MNTPKISTDEQAEKAIDTIIAQIRASGLEMTPIILKAALKSAYVMGRFDECDERLQRMIKEGV